MNTEYRIKKEVTCYFELGDPRIEIDGLRSEYAVDESIHFEVLAIGDESGCLLFDVTIREDENAPPVYSQGYVSQSVKYLKNMLGFHFILILIRRRMKLQI